MEKHQVIPDAIDQSPAALLSVTYCNDKMVRPGDEFKPLEVREQPAIKWEGKNNKYYTLLMVDLDVPSRSDPKSGELVHWLIGNILGSVGSSGDVYIEYIGAGPPKDSGLHRYVFLLYEQEGRMDFEEPKVNATTVRPRFGFKARKFAEKYNLGNPVAGNFFQAEWDPSVEEFMKQFTAKR